ncbi:GDSL-type esterase/lipase family protein [Paenibacillus sp. NFR01]|uniref:GDSL-type esterase/lipase family protein n=1 Tax=Paenibacillus sp. NFR01 TaxID=1566279 RepID=UPI0008C95205|nr:GDSL-type esterase/lipase family protein [Paenibacillus sp. NFR01]SEU22761.1 Lysophospholipase L1 [Paenibacillus sp. NFR01]
MSYHYTAIGDSLTTGFGALPGNGFVPVYRRLAEGRLHTSVNLTNLGVNGLTTDGLEQRLKNDYNYRLAVRDADIVTLSIGGNDLIKAAKAAGNGAGELSSLLEKALRNCKRNFGDIMGTVAQLKAGLRKPYIIRIVGLYNPYPQIAEATQWVKAFNRHAAGYSSMVCGFASIYQEFAGNERGLLFIDHLHPNGRGYQVIAAKLNGLGYGHLG